MAPNEIYENAAGNIEDSQIAGDLGDIWEKICGLKKE